VSDVREGPLASSQIRYVAREAVGFPTQLSELHDPPDGLFLRGGDLLPRDRLVAIVGARACSPAGAEIARSIARGLAEAGFAVVSGAARGIDSAAHEGSIAGGAPTVAVLGSGIDVPYPRGSAALLARIAETGTVVSEYPPGVPAMAFRFPARNRIVVALARALVVVEGEAGSGSLISAEHALDLGRDVFAVPGAVTNPLSATPNALIRDGAALVRGAEDVLEELGVAPSGGAGAGVQLPLDLPEAERRAFEAVTDRALPETVAAALGRPIDETLAVLFRLELAGLLRSVGGRYERRLRGKGSGDGP
jgi:DNA processing protein